MLFLRCSHLYLQVFNKQARCPLVAQLAVFPVILIFMQDWLPVQSNYQGQFLHHDFVL